MLHKQNSSSHCRRDSTHGAFCVLCQVPKIGHSGTRTVFPDVGHRWAGMRRQIPVSEDGSPVRTSIDQPGSDPSANWRVSYHLNPPLIPSNSPGFPWHIKSQHPILHAVFTSHPALRQLFAPISPWKKNAHTDDCYMDVLPAIVVHIITLHDDHLMYLI